MLGLELGLGLGLGKYDLVTCINRSEMTQNGDCFIATGSRDSTIMIWIWNGSKGKIEVFFVIRSHTVMEIFQVF